jgi:excinuclease ABC subunit C
MRVAEGRRIVPPLVGSQKAKTLVAREEMSQGPHLCTASLGNPADEAFSQYKFDCFDCARRLAAEQLARLFRDSLFSGCGGFGKPDIPFKDRGVRTALQRIRENLDSFPRAPGVYVMKDAGGRQLYIGKAVDLRSRIKTYLDMQDDRRQVPMLLKKVSHIDWIATSNESEALILEANLVRTHKPRYNLDLKDDKHYPYLKVTLNEAFPRLVVVRRVQKDGGRYFGPYTDATTMRKVMSFAKKAFRLCDCKRILRPRPNMRPCLNYAIGRCSGACAGKITREAYRENIELLLKFLAGHRTGVISELRRRMEEASARLEFERAASLRDQIEIIGTASRLQKVDLRERDINRDVLGI